MRRWQDCDEMLPPPRRTTLSKVGRYTVTKGGKPDKFWPLDPGRLGEVRSVFTATADVMPTIWGSDLSTLVLPPQYGIFDIIVHFSDDFEQLSKEEIEAESLDRDYSFPWLMGRPTKSEMALAADEFQDAHIAFAVYIEPGKSEFQGKLQLEANLAGGLKKRIELPIMVKKFVDESALPAGKPRTAEFGLADDLFVFFICHKGKFDPVTELPKVSHTWCKIKAVGKGGAPIEDAMTMLQVLRDNDQHGYQNRNRRTYLYSQSDGYFAAFGTRKVVGLPMEWPIIFNATKDGYVTRGHMLRLTGNGDTKDNMHPLTEPAARTQIPMLTVAEGDLGKFAFLLDPGHGVVYADKKNRRSQEWLSAQKLAESVRDILISRFNVQADNIYWTRTAGFGLIAPGELDDLAAPEHGSSRYVFGLADPANRRIRVDSNTPVSADGRLLALSDLLLTTHDDSDAPQPVPVNRRTTLLQLNPTTVQGAVTRRLSALNLHWRIADGTFAWDADLTAYTFTVQRRRPNGTWVNAGPGNAGWDDGQGQYTIAVDVAEPTAAETAAMAHTLVIQINHTDWFTIDDEMMRTLEDRSARWSIRSEIGFDKNATPAQKKDWLDRTRDAMVEAGALQYMKDRIRWSNDRPELLAHGTMGWDVSQRYSYFNQANAPWDFIVSIHENANLTGKQKVGFQALIAEDDPPAEQIRIAKTFVKYVDPFDQGTFCGGVSDNSALLVNDGGHRTKHVFLELEFMDTHIQGTADFQYRDMLSDLYLMQVSEALVAGIVEWMVKPQDKATFNAIKYRGATALW